MASGDGGVGVLEVSIQHPGWGFGGSRHKASCLPLGLCLCKRCPSHPARAEGRLPPKPRLLRGFLTHPQAQVQMLAMLSIFLLLFPYLEQMAGARAGGLAPLMLAQGLF